MGFKEIKLLMGVNRFDDPRKISDDEVVSAKNIVPVTKGMPQKRLGTVADASPRQVDYCDIVPVALMNDPVPDMAWCAATFNRILARGYNGLYCGGLATKTPGKYTPVIIAYGSNVYVFFGFPHVTTGYVISATNLTGATATTVEAPAFAFAGVGNGSIVPAGACVYRERMVFFNFGPGYEDYVVIADPFDPTKVGDNLLTINSRAFRVGGVGQGRIVAAVPISQSVVGAPVDSALMFLKEGRAFIMTGEPNKTTDTGDMFQNMTITEINYTCGCASPDTVVSTPYGKFWAGVDDVWFLADGALPVRIGSKIRPVLEATANSNKYRWNASYFNGFYRLAVFSPGQDAGSSDAPTYLGEQWWLDLRDGPPEGHQDARWWGPQKFKRPPTASNNGPWLDGTNGQWLQKFGDKTLLVDYVDMNTSVGLGAVALRLYYDMGAHQDGINWADSTLGANASKSYMGNDSSIMMEIITKKYDFEAGFVQKRFIRMVADYWTSFTDYLRLDATRDGGMSVDTTTATAEQAGLIVTADIIENAMAEKFQEASLYPTTRIPAKLWQFRIYDTPGFVITDNNDTLCIYNNQNTTYYTITLTRGYYASMTTLLAHIISRLNASVPGGSFSSTWAFSTASGIPIIQIANGSGTWRVFGNSNFGGSTFTATQLAVCANLMALLGWAGTVTDLGLTQPAGWTPEYPFVTRSANWKFNKFVIEYDTFGRG